MEISEEIKAMLIAEAKHLLEDKNRMSKALAAMLRNKIEDFHVSYLSDDQMKELNPLLRNAIFTFLTDFDGIREQLDEIGSIQDCCNYIEAATIPFFQKYLSTEEVFDEFLDLIFEELQIGMVDAADSGVMLISNEKLFVPQYWEDCIYLETIHNK